MRLLASITLCAAVHALAPLRDGTTARAPLCRLHGDRRYRAASVWTHGAFSHARRGGTRPRAGGVLRSSPDGSDGPRRRRTGGILRSSPDDVDDEVVTGASDADFGGAVINAVTAVLGVAVAISTVCNLAGYGFIQTDEGLYFGTIQQTRMRYQLDQEAGRAR